VLNHDGKISLDSKEGQGTSFTISLPQQKQDQIETNPTEVKV
jgi:signal transduction histidine kinase